MQKRLIKTVDYLVVGAGSAGCVLANRLSKSHSVCVIEAGKKDINRLDSWTLQMPAALTYSVADARYNWDYHTNSQPGLNNRLLHQPRGKVLGGSSSINAMVYVRGHPEDYERWEKEQGVKGWGYKNVLPYFKKAQTFDGRGESDEEKKDNKYRGRDGPLQVTSYARGTRTNELFDALEQSGLDAGYKYTHDTNGYNQEGFGPFDMTIDKKSGVRCSAATAYLHPAMNDPKRDLEVKTSTLCRRVIFEQGRAVGIECEDTTTGEVFEMRAKKEVILSLGAVGSPHLLMLSGVGDQKELQKHGIHHNVLHNPHVGANLQDHLEVYLQYLSKLPVSLYPVAAWTIRHLHKRVAVGAQWFLNGSGIGASNQFETGAFFRSDAGIKHPDVQIHFIPGCVVGQLDFLPQHGFQLHVGTLRPTSRGSITLASSNPKIAPIIDPQFLTTEKDIRDMRNAVRLSDELVQQPAFAKYKSDRFAPSHKQVSSDIARASDEEIDSWVRSSSHSAYHLSCTCAMGKVVNEEGLVTGLQGLRVVDASIMPSMTSGNLNAPTIMLAEKIADAIQGVQLPPQENAPYYVDEQWETKQR